MGIILQCPPKEFENHTKTKLLIKSHLMHCLSLLQDSLFGEKTVIQAPLCVCVCID